jgi:flagellar motor protein MotB
MTAANPRTALAEAARHARAGRYDRARRALEPVGEDAAALDLLARVHAQQGDLAAADECWARVEGLDPAHSGAREGRRRIRRIWSRRPRRVGAVAVVLVLIAAGAAGGRALAPSGPDGGQAVADELERLAGAVDAIESAEPAGEPTTEAAESLVDGVLVALEDPRWSAAVEGDAVKVVFDESVFPEGGTALTAESRDVLADVAAKVASLDAEITVVGHTNDIPTGEGSRYEDNAALGLARALAAAEAMADAGGQALADIGIATAGDEDPPYGNETEADRVRNQTVTLEVAPA